MTRYDVFLSHNSADKAAVEELAHRLADEAGLTPFLDKWHLIPGDPWQEAIEEALYQSRTCAVFIGPGGISPWENEEMRAAIEQHSSNRTFRVIPVLLPGAERGERGRLPAFLTRATWVEFRQGLDDSDSFHRLVAGIKGLAPGRGPSQTSYEGVCPYRGLQVFEAQHVPFFFGREAATEWLINELRPSARRMEKSERHNRFLAVIGPSGSGKSSLVRAGLVPGLQRGDLPGSQTWPLHVFRPSHYPIESLAIVLANLFSSISPPVSLVQLITDLAADKRQLHQTVQTGLADVPPNQYVVLVVDQFEEIFTHCRDESQRKAFIDNLLYASAVEGGRLVVIMTLRADFYGKCANYPELAARVTDHQMLVSPMVIEELRRVIERPAQLVGLEFEPGLADTLLSNVKAEPGMLPLLQHTLLELWERRQRRHLTFSAYREIGGIQGAIAHRAESVYAGFDEKQKMLTRRIMLRLTQPGEGTEDTRRQAAMAEFLPVGSETSDIEITVRALADARLLTTGKDEQGNEIIDVAHEALIRGWPRLRSWIDEDRAALRIHRRLTEAVTEWKKNNLDESYLYHGLRLVEAEEWAKTHPDDLNKLEQAFLEASLLNAKRIAQATEAIYRLNRIRQISLNEWTLVSVLETIALSVHEILDADIVDIYQYIQYGHEFILPPVRVGERRFPAIPKVIIYNDDTVVEAVRMREPRYFAEAQEVLLLTAPFKVLRNDVPDHRFVIREDIVSTAVIPLIIANETVGVMFVNYRSRQSFDPKQRDIIESFANQAAVTIYNARLFQGEQAQRQQLDILRVVAQIVNSTLELTEVIGIILEQLHQVVEYDSASVFQFTEEEHCTLIGGRGFLVEEPPKRLRNVSEDPLIVKIVQERRPIVLSNVIDEPMWCHTPENARVNSWIGVPLVAGDQVIGLLTVDHSEAGYYTPESGNNLAAFANLVAMAIYKAALVQKLYDQRKP